MNDMSWTISLISTFFILCLSIIQFYLIIHYVKQYNKKDETNMKEHFNKLAKNTIVINALMLLLFIVLLCNYIPAIRKELALYLLGLN